MIRSDTLSELNTALSAAQGEFEAVSKTAANPFFKSKYAALPDVVKAATPILSKHGLSVWQGGDTDEAGELLWTVVLHSSGQYIGSAARLLPVKNDPQAQGSATTYQRRYQFMAALGLVADEDDDGNAASGRTVSRSNARKSTTRGKTQDKPAEPASEPQDGSGGLVVQQVTDTTLAELAKLAKQAFPQQAERTREMRKMMDEAGAKGRKSDELSQDEASWIVLALREKVKA